MKKQFKGMVLALVAMPIVAVLIFAYTQRRAKPAANTQVPSFSLVNQEGGATRRSDLLGKVWVANFIFTSCAGVCPMLNEKMKRVLSEFEHDPHFQAVSFSVDPETDTPSVLKNYAKRYSASSDRWLFLTGPRADLKSILQDGFKVVMAGMEDMDKGMITHSNKFVVVDRFGKIRSYHDMAEEEDDYLGLKRSITKYLGKRF